MGSAGTRPRKPARHLPKLEGPPADGWDWEQRHNPSTVQIESAARTGRARLVPDRARVGAVLLVLLVVALLVGAIAPTIRPTS
jgi:hypothetical protein